MKTEKWRNVLYKGGCLTLEGTKTDG